jgi:hypothetical protein
MDIKIFLEIVDCTCEMGIFPRLSEETRAQITFQQYVALKILVGAR